MPDPHIPPLRDLLYQLDCTWGVLKFKGSWGVLVVPYLKYLRSGFMYALYASQPTLAGFQASRKRDSCDDFNAIACQ